VRRCARRPGLKTVMRSRWLNDFDSMTHGPNARLQMRARDEQ
jgi:hypothetical protein